jgi:hypothetical protein
MVKRGERADVNPFKENPSESEYFYFLDPDGHQLELHVGDWRTKIVAKKFFI